MLLSSCLLFYYSMCIVFYTRFLRWGALRRSHFQCGKCEGRRSQSSVARTPSLALPPRWARKEFFVVVCAALLTFVCMLRYSKWNVVLIWFLYSSIFIVVCYADLIPGFFSAYRGTLCRSDSRILQCLSWYAMPIWFLDPSVLMLLLCANLVSGFFGTYTAALCRPSTSFLMH